MPLNNRAKPALVQRTTIFPAKERARHAPMKNQSRVPKWKNTTTLPIVFFVANCPSTFVKTPLPNASNANWGITATVNPAVNAKQVRTTPVYYNDNYNFVATILTTNIFTFFSPYSNALFILSSRSYFLLPLILFPGSYCLNGRKQFCAPGKYGETVAAKTEGVGCKDCNAGRYQIARGQTSCTKCEAGLFSNKTKQIERTDCTSCTVPGHYCPAGTSKATKFPCEMGTFSDQIEATECKTCIYTFNLLFYSI